jgi:hypothetical protein
MAAVGTVTYIKGLVYALKADGTERLLALGDELFADEVVRTSPDAAVEIQMTNGQEVALGGGQSWLVSLETYTEVNEYPVNQAVASANEADVEAIQQAILAGEDPTQIAEAAAAGPQAGEDGEDGVRFEILTRTALEENPEAGYETIGVSRAFEEELRDSYPDETQNLPELRVNDVVANESDGVIVFTITLDEPASEDITFTYATSNGSAIGSQDYVSITGTATIPAGSTQVTITVSLIDDYVSEPTETFNLNIIEVTTGNAAIADGSGVGTILDDGSPDDQEGSVVTLSAPSLVSEGDSITVTATVDNPPVDSPLAITLSNGQTITIEVGETVGTVSFSAGDDAYVDPDLLLDLSIESTTGGNYENLDTTSTTAVTIVDDNDATLITLSGADTVVEGQPVTITTTVSNAPENTPLVITLDNGQIIKNRFDFIKLDISIKRQLQKLL